MQIFTQKPTNALCSYVNFYWSLESSTDEYVEEQLIYPEGTTDLMFHYGKPFSSKLDSIDYIEQPQVLFCGQKTSSAKVLSGSNIGMIAINFKPFGASAFFKLPFAEIRNQNLNAEFFLDNSIKILNEEIANAKNFHARVEIIENFLKRQILTNVEYDILRLNAAHEQLLKNVASFKVDDFAKSACFSFRTLDRIFQKRVGLSPKEFLKIERLKGAIEMMKAKDNANLTTIACASGYFDQSHFCKDFNNIVGINPKEFAKLLASEPQCI